VFVSRKRVLIDGHNAMYRLGIQGLDHAAKRSDLVRTVGSLVDNATVYFDARRFTGPRPPRRSRDHGVRVEYCHQREADEEILDAVRAANSPRGILVVSSDREVTGKASQLGASTQTVEEFFGQEAQETQEDEGERRDPGPGGMTPEEFGLPDIVEW